MVSRLRTYRWRCIAWAMTPLAVVAGMPTSRCACTACERPAACKCCCGLAGGACRATGKCCCGCCAMGEDLAATTRVQSSPQGSTSSAVVARISRARDIANDGSSCRVQISTHPCVVPAHVAIVVPVDGWSFTVPLACDQIAPRPGPADAEFCNLHLGPCDDLVVRLRCLLI